MSQPTYDYVASPYTHESELIREERYLRVSFYVVQCLSRGDWVYSPIVHCHELAKTWSFPKDAGFWHGYNRAMLTHAANLRVLRLDGWKESEGIKGEIKLADHQKIRVIYV